MPVITQAANLVNNKYESQKQTVAKQYEVCSSSKLPLP